MLPETLDLMEIINILCRFGVVIVVTIKLVRFYEMYQKDERLGLGIAGGCALMTVPVIWEGPESPFAEWAATAFAFGVLVYFAGRLRRQYRHALHNKQAAAAATKHLREKAKQS